MAQVLPVAEKPGPPAPPSRQRLKVRRHKQKPAPVPPPVKYSTEPYKPPPVEEPRKPYTLPTLEDCQTRDVHYFKTGLKGKKPDCDHQATFKQCNNCGKIVWTYCARCELEKSEQRSRANFGRIVSVKPKKNQNQK